MRRTNPDSGRVLFLLPLVICLTGCITGDEAEEDMFPSPEKRLADLEQAHEIGVISDVEYEANKRTLEAEIRSR
ncbi:MAG: hypothetical protein VX726_08770 [Planctomycetota bacterium]|nr:hypothetical protein [Planctomycetota bacterium]